MFQAHPGHFEADLVVVVLGVISLIGMVFFFFSYVGFFNFVKTPAGRAVAGLVGSQLLIALTNILAWVFGRDYWGRDTFRILAWLAVVAAITYLNVALFGSRAQHPAEIGLDTGPSKVSRSK